MRTDDPAPLIMIFDQGGSSSLRGGYREHGEGGLSCRFRWLRRSGRIGRINPGYAYARARQGERVRWETISHMCRSELSSLSSLTPVLVNIISNINSLSILPASSLEHQKSSLSSLNNSSEKQELVERWTVNARC